MGSIVENNVVKKEWQKKGWFEVKNNTTKKKTFIFASQVYEGADGQEVTVFFVPDTVFVLYDADEGLYDAADMAETWKANGGIGNFPYALDTYLAIIESGEDKCVESVLEQFGLEQYREDIEERFQDIIPYGYETEVSFGV